MENRPSEFITDPAKLGVLLRLPEPIMEEACHVLKKKDADPSKNVPRLRIPKSLLSRMEPGNGADPILLQFLPRSAEREEVPGFCDDPLCEFSTTAEDGSEQRSDVLLQKYVGRVLLITGGVCAANCRFCFRRHAPKEKNLFASTPAEEIASTPTGEKASGETDSAENRLPSLFEALNADPTLREIILSGGDPLGLSDRQLTLLFDYIMRLSFVKRVRIHSRYPVLIPGRITDSLLHSLEGFREAKKTLVIVFHLNHPAEIDEEVGRMFRQLASVGAILLSQTVLLRGVNDDATTLAALFEKEATFSVLPYYLHQLDRVTGAAHFEVTPERGREIVRELRRILPGYLIPRYVREIPGAPAKTPME